MGGAVPCDQPCCRLWARASHWLESGERGTQCRRPDLSLGRHGRLRLRVGGHRYPRSGFARLRGFAVWPGLSLHYIIATVILACQGLGEGTDMISTSRVQLTFSPAVNDGRHRSGNHYCCHYQMLGFDLEGRYSRIGRYSRKRYMGRMEDSCRGCRSYTPADNRHNSYTIRSDYRSKRLGPCRVPSRRSRGGRRSSEGQNSRGSHMIVPWLRRWTHPELSLPG